MGFFLGKNLVFIDSMQFKNSSLDKLDKNLSGEDFKHFVEEFGPKKLELFKTKRCLSLWVHEQFWKFLKKTFCLTKNVSLIQQQKKKNLVMVVKY